MLILFRVDLRGPGQVAQLEHDLDTPRLQVQTPEKAYIRNNQGMHKY